MLSGLTLGNGDFAFTTDFTGIQSFNASDVKGKAKSCGDLSYAVCPRYTMASWGWHAERPESSGANLSAFRFANLTAYRRSSAYPLDGASFSKQGVELQCDSQCQKAARFLRGNPHKFSLGRLFFLDGSVAGDGIPIEPAACTNISQHLDLFTSVLVSNFTLWGERVSVTTVVSMDEDIIAVRINSSLLTSGRLKLGVAFPYAADYSVDEHVFAADYGKPNAHATTATIKVVDQKAAASFHRELDAQSYDAAVSMEEAGTSITAMAAPHGFVLNPSAHNSVAHVVLGYSNGSAAATPTMRPSSLYWYRTSGSCRIKDDRILKGFMSCF